VSRGPKHPDEAVALGAAIIQVGFKTGAPYLRRGGD
jgi:hypothetical protein